MTTQIECPNCGTLVTWGAASPWRPFCSDRCRLIDLGDWAAERHVIPGKLPLGDDEASRADSNQREPDVRGPGSND